MISQAEARRIAEEFLDEMRARFPHEIVIVEEAIEDRADAWVFPYDGRGYIERDDINEVMLGNRPLVVDKKTFDTLSAADQKIVTDEVAATFDTLDKMNRSDNTSARDALKSQGIAFYAPDDAEKKRWEGVGADAYKALTADHSFSPELQKALDAALAEARGGSK